MLLRRSAWLLLLSVAVAGADEGATELRESSKLMAHRLKAPLLRQYRLPEGAEAAEEPAARRARVGREFLLLADVDGNGRFDDLGVDGWTFAKLGYPYLLPLEKKLVVGADEVDWAIEEETLRFRQVHIIAPRDLLRALLLLNDLRARNGLVPVRIDRRLSEAAARNDEYMERYGLTHRQGKGMAGYSEEGAKAGMASVLYAGPPDAAAAWYWCSAFHRFPLAHPDTRSFGLAASRSYTVCDGERDRAPRRWAWPVILPAPDSVGHPIRIAQQEKPSVQERLMNPGAPISIHFRTGARVTEVRAELRVGGPRGGLVSVRVFSPEKPATEDLPNNDDSILVVPTTPLATRTRYFALVSYVHAGKPVTHEWSFTTGKDILR